MSWRRILCLINRHQADIKGIRWDGAMHVSTCSECRCQIRLSSKGYWKRTAAATISTNAADGTHP